MGGGFSTFDDWECDYDDRPQSTQESLTYGGAYSGSDPSRSTYSRSNYSESSSRQDYPSLSSASKRRSNVRSHGSFTPGYTAHKQSTTGPAPVKEGKRRSELPKEDTGNEYQFWVRKEAPVKKR